MGGVPALEHVERPGSEGQDPNVPVLSGKKPTHPFVVRIRSTSQPASVLEPSARDGCLQQEGRGELCPVEVPVECFACPVGHDIDPGERIRHRVEPGLVHRRCEEVDERFPFVDPSEEAVPDLICADSVIHGSVAAKRRVAGVEISDGVVEVNVVLSGVRERGGSEHWSCFCNAARKRLRKDEALEVEHAGAVQLLPAMREQRPSWCAVELVQGEAVEIEKFVHEFPPFVPRAVHEAVLAGEV